MELHKILQLYYKTIGGAMVRILSFYVEVNGSNLHTCNPFNHVNLLGYQVWLGYLKLYFRIHFYPRLLKVLMLI
jgi:hypothetical protein